MEDNSNTKRAGEAIKAANSLEEVMAATDSIVVDLDEVRVDFTELPPDKVLCPSCSKVFRNPHATTCCRTTYCRKCLDTARDRSCPKCRAGEWDYQFDGDSQRLVNELYVRCLHVSDGCLWFGHLEQLPNHISRENSGGCIFVTLGCPHSCGEKFSRKNLKDHVASRCRKRPYSCEHCGETDGVYEDVETNHFPLCSKYPVPCPNKCPLKTVPRSSLDNHIKRDCEYQGNIPCPFSFAGCKAKLQRKMIITHLEKNIGMHLMQMSSAFSDNKKDVDEKLESLPSLVAAVTASSSSSSSTKMDEDLQDILKSKDAEIRKLKNEMRDLRREREENDMQLQKLLDKARHSLELQEQRLSLVEQQNHALTQNLSVLRQFLPNPLPITFTINKFDQLRQANKWWYSRPFFSHVAGYKLGMFVFCNGVLDGKNTHISVFLYLVRGEYDNDLDWPFQGSVTIHLINQRGDRQHYQKVIRFTEDTPLAVSNRVTESEMAKEGNGPTQFISQADLTYNQQKDTEYVRDDCLKIRVTSIHIKNSRTPGASNNTGTTSSRVPGGFKSQSIDSTDSHVSNGYGDRRESTTSSPIMSPVKTTPSPVTASLPLLEVN